MSALHPEICHKLQKQDSLHPALGWEGAAVELGRGTLRDSFGHWVKKQITAPAEIASGKGKTQHSLYMCEKKKSPYAIETNDKAELF